MNRLLTIAAICGSVAGLQATPVLVDNFSTDQLVLAGPVGGNPLSASGGVATGANSIGAARTVVVTRNTGNSVNFINVNLGIAEISSAAGDTATAVFTWDGDTDVALNPLGLGGADLTSGGSNVFMFLAVRSDLANAPIRLRVYTDALNASEATVFTPGGGFGATPFTPHYILFSSFTNVLGSGANFANIGAITLTVDGSGIAGLDTQIDLVEALGTPEPSTMALIGGGLVIAALKGRKRK